MLALLTTKKEKDILTESYLTSGALKWLISNLDPLPTNFEEDTVWHPTGYRNSISKFMSRALSFIQAVAIYLGVHKCALQSRRVFGAVCSVSPLH